MYRHLLVPIERSDACVEAIGHAAELARSLGARITFFYPQTNANDDAVQHRHVVSLLARAEAAARAQGVPASVSTAQGGQPAREYDLVCIAHGAAMPPVPGVAVLVCPRDARPMVAKAVGALLAVHRTRSDAYDDALLMARPDAHAIERLREAHGEEHALTTALRERTSSLDAELDELARLAGREADLLARVAQSVMNDVAVDDALHACARFAWERMGRVEGVVLPAARRFLRDENWSALAEEAR
ncbi:universal stress protein [Caballeronia novacaledonica]|uniref:Universal stress protein n=1 Tax=Caballeronia novacaledonica TaxID=1544861 RepID=A0A2U3I5S1_9BURK|nr:universal stress protein [Caballeronia novacaledonica]SPB15451.1 universal stress protein [Caballeronia novacaledonica]